MVTPECCEEREDGYQYGQQDNALKLEPEEVEEVRLDDDLEPDEHHNLQDELAVGLTDRLDDLDVKRNLLQKSLFREKFLLAMELSRIHHRVLFLSEGNLEAGVLCEEENGESGREVLDHNLTNSWPYPLLFVSHQEVWLPRHHGPVDVGDDLPEEDEPNRGEIDVEDVEEMILLIASLPIIPLQILEDIVVVVIDSS